MKTGYPLFCDISEETGIMALGTQDRICIIKPNDPPPLYIILEKPNLSLGKLVGNLLYFTEGTSKIRTLDLVTGILSPFIKFKSEIQHLEKLKDGRVIIYLENKFCTLKNGIICQTYYDKFETLQIIRINHRTFASVQEITGV